MNKEIIIYHKFCLECYWDEEFRIIKSYAQNKRYKLSTVRTTSDLKIHEKATEIYGSPRYKAFVYENGNVTEIADFAKKCKAKPIKNTKAKAPAKKRSKKNDNK